MKYRNIVLMKFSAGQQWRNRHKEQTYTHEGGEEDGREVQEGGNICIPMADSC